MAAKKELEEWFANNGNTVTLVKLKEVLKRIDPLYSEPSIDSLFQAAGYSKDASMDKDDFMKLFFGEKPAVLPLVNGFNASKAQGKPELIYFPGPGRAELTRLALAAGGVEYTDTRIPMDGWPAVKNDPKSVPAQMFGSMPCIEHGAVKIAQSTACAQYAADLGINKKNNPSADQRALDSMIMGAHADLLKPMYSCLFGDDASKAAGLEALPGATKGTLAGIERAYERSGGPLLYSKDGPTLGDLAVLDVVSSPFPGLLALKIDLSPYPKINACVEACKADAVLKLYLEKRGF